MPTVSSQGKATGNSREEKNSNEESKEYNDLISHVVLEHREQGQGTLEQIHNSDKTVSRKITKELSREDASTHKKTKIDEVLVLCDQDDFVSTTDNQENKPLETFGNQKNVVIDENKALEKNEKQEIDLSNKILSENPILNSLLRN